MNVLLSARAVSDWTPTYQWLVNEKPLVGRTSPTLSLFCVSMVQSGQVYSVIASNAYGSVTSAPALLQVVEPDYGPTPYIWGVNETVVHDRFNAELYRHMAGRQINVELQNTNTGGLWGTGIYTDDSSISAAAYHAGMLPTGAKGTVAILLMGPQSTFAGSTQNGITSSSYTREWGGSFQFLGVVPTITQHPLSQVRMVGGQAMFTAAATGEGPLAYQWKHNGVVMPGKTDATLTVDVQSEADGGSYAVTITDDVGSNSSDYAILGVVPRAASWPKAPEANPLSFAPGEFRHMTVTGQTNYGSVWGNGFYTTDSEIQKAAVHDGWIQHGEAAVIKVVRLPDQGLFVASTRNSVQTRRYGSFTAFAIVGVTPTITKDPVSQALFPGQHCRLFTEATHSMPIRYQWRKDGVAIPGATGTELVVAAGSSGAINVYDVVADVPGNPVPSHGAYVFTVPDDAGYVEVANGNEALARLAQPNTIITASLKGALSPSYIYGTGIYTSDSNPDVASVHADRLRTGDVSEVSMYTLGLWPGFFGSTRNTLSSGSYAGMAGYVFIFPPFVQPPALSVVGGGRLLITGPAGRQCQIWATPSLQQPQWTLIDTITLLSASQQWQDPQPAQDTRFYKVALVQ